MNSQPSTILSRRAAGAKAIVMTAEDAAKPVNVAALRRIGINISPRFVASQMENMAKAGFAEFGMDGDSFAMDDALAPLTPASLGAPIQFLQAWLPGFVQVLTAARKIDDLIGIVTAGKWEDEEVIQGVLEPTGHAELYGDLTNVPLASWNPGFERRSVIRWEMGFRVGVLEEARAARMKVNSASEKRNAAVLSLEIMRNRVGFFGFNAGNNRTYGFLNDPALPAYVAAGGVWSGRTFLQITADIRGMIARLQTATQDVIDLQKQPITFVLASNVAPYLSITSDFGNSVRGWLQENYPNITVKTAPELNLANGGANVAYMYPENIPDGGSDGGAVWAQVVPAKFQPLGTDKQAKAYVEDFTNATAGVMVKRPYAIQRLTGL